MSEALERVAKAIWDAEHCGVMPFPTEDGFWREMAFWRARAAIDAMREPFTEEEAHWRSRQPLGSPASPDR